MPMFDIDCDTCGLVEDVIVGVRDRVDGMIECPGCEARVRTLPSMPNFIFGGDEAGVGRIYPYFDRSLNRRVHSHKHRQRLMKARGLTEVTTGDVQRAAAKVKREDEALDQRTKERARLVEEHPGFRDFRRDRDKGQLTDHIKDPKRKKATEKSLGVTHAG